MSVILKAEEKEEKEEGFIEGLPKPIQEKIFAFLDWRERVRVERVSSEWCRLVRENGWTDVRRRLYISREMLQIRCSITSSSSQVDRESSGGGHRTKPVKMNDEDRKMKKFLKAVLWRAGPELQTLLLFGVEAKFRWVKSLQWQHQLAHLRVDTPLSRWELDQIGEHCPRLRSLFVTPEHSTAAQSAYGRLLDALGGQLTLSSIGLFNKVNSYTKPSSYKILSELVVPKLRALEVALFAHYFAGAYHWDEVAEMVAALEAACGPSLRFIRVDPRFSSANGISVDLAKCPRLQGLMNVRLSEGFVDHLRTAPVLSNLVVLQLNFLPLSAEELTVLVEHCPLLVHFSVPLEKEAFLEALGAFSAPQNLRMVNSLELRFSESMWEWTEDGECVEKGPDPLFERTLLRFLCAHNEQKRPLEHLFTGIYLYFRADFVLAIARELKSLRQLHARVDVVWRRRLPAEDNNNNRGEIVDICFEDDDYFPPLPGRQDNDGGGYLPTQLGRIWGGGILPTSFPPNHPIPIHRQFLIRSHRWEYAKRETEREWALIEFIPPFSSKKDRARVRVTTEPLARDIKLRNVALERAIREQIDERIFIMTRYGKNATSSAVYAYGERVKDAKQSGYGSLVESLGADLIKPFDYCSLTLQSGKEPLIPPQGFIFDREAILNYILDQKNIITKNLFLEKNLKDLYFLCLLIKLLNMIQKT